MRADFEAFAGQSGANRRTEIGTESADEYALALVFAFLAVDGDRGRRSKQQSQTHRLVESRAGDVQIEFPDVFRPSSA